MDTIDSDERAPLLARIAQLEAEVAELKGDSSSFHRLTLKGIPSRQAKLLVFLAQGYPSVFSREAIAAAIGYSTDRGTKGVEVLVCKTRRALKALAIPGQVETVHRGGYKLSASLKDWVSRTTQPESATDDRQLLLPLEEASYEA